jgi:aldehyde:ferredoxin oxidoreductase
MASFCLKPPYHIHNYPKLIAAATGMDIDEAKLKRIVNRSRNLHRAFNLLRGLRRADERPPQDHWKHRFPEIEEKLLTTYYKYKGWNYDGVPTKERLHELDLDYVAEELEKRGIYKNGQDQENDQDNQD